MQKSLSTLATAVLFLSLYGFAARKPLLAQTAVYPGAIAGDNQLKVGVNGVSTLLTSAINSGQTTFAVSACARIVTNVLITIDSEIMPVSGCTGGTLIVGSRGFDGTAAATHAAGTVVSAYVDAWHHNSVKAEVTAVETALGVGAANIKCPAVIGATCDVNFSSLAAAFAAAGSGPLYITQAWNGLNTATYTAPVTYLGNGRIQPASGQTVTLNPNFTAGAYQYIFDTHLGGTIAFSGTPPSLNPNWFGADWTGAADSLPAFNAAKATGNTISVPLGTYSFTTGGFQLSANYSHLTCDPGTVIQYTGGSGPIDSTLHIGTSGGGYSIGLSAEGCTVLGDNRYATSALHVDHNGHSLFQNMKVRGGITQAIYVDTSVVVELNSVQVTHDDRAWPSNLEPSLGIHVYSSNVVTMISPTVEYIAQSQAALATTTGTASSGSTALTIASGTGTANTQAVFCVGIAPGTTVASGGGTTSITLSQNTIGAVSGTCTFGFTGGTGTGIEVDGSEATTIIGGTSESNNVNVDVLNGSQNTQILNMDDEAPYTYCIRDNGDLTSILDGYYVTASPDTYSYPAILLGSHSNSFYTQSAIFDTEAFVAPITIASGAVNAHIGGANRFGTEIFGSDSLVYTISDSGTATILDCGNTFINTPAQMICYNNASNNTMAGGVSFGMGQSTQVNSTNLGSLISGHVNTANVGGGGTMTWVDGNLFQTWWTGSVPINGTLYIIGSCTSQTVCTLTTNPGSHSAITYGSANNALFATLQDAGTGLPLATYSGTEILLNVSGFTLQAGGPNSLIVNGVIYSGSPVPIASQYGTQIGVTTISGVYYRFVALDDTPGTPIYWLLEGAPPPISCSSTAVPSGGGTPTITCTQ